MKEACIPTRLISAAGLVAWAGVILLPLLVLLSASIFSSGQEDVPSLAGLMLPSIKLAAVIAAAAVLLGYIPGRILGTLPNGNAPLLMLFLMPLLLPRHMLYYAWTLLLNFTTPQAAKMIGELTSSVVMVLWYWPLAALLIAQGFRTLDKDVWDSGRLEAGVVRRFFRVTLPLLAGPLTLAFGVCFALCLAEFGTFHLAGIRTIGTELAVLYELTGNEGVVGRAAWPIGLVGLAMGLMLWKKSRDWTVGASMDRVTFGSQNFRWIVLAVLLMLSLGIPTMLLVANAGGFGPLGQFLSLHIDGLLWSGISAVGAAVLAVLIACGASALDEFGAVGRLLSAVVHTAIFLAMFLPGSIVAMAMLRMLGLFGLANISNHGWYIVSAGLAMRFSGIVLILLRLARDSRQKQLAEMACSDGASGVKAWFYVHLPGTWPVLLGAFLIVVMFSMTEISASMVLLPPGLPSFAQRLLNQMHYARDQHVIASCLVLLGVYVVLSAVVVALLKLIRTKRALILILCAAALSVSGCSSRSDESGRAKVLDAFGKAGMGRCEFIYPRAITMGLDGSLFVIDKAGIIQRLTRKGDFLGSIKMPRIDSGKPTGLSIGPDGNLYVADTHCHRVMVFSPDGKILRQFGKLGRGQGEFIYPTDVAFAADGRIFVSEYGGNDRISVFSFQGKFLYSFGRLGSDANAKEFARPSALCVDHRRKRLYIADACNHRIAIYSLDGLLLGHIGSLGRGLGQLRYPYDLAMLNDGRLVVCEYGNNRIQVFSPDGKPLGIYGQPGRVLGRLASPWGLAVDEHDRVYIIDSGNNRVQVWQL